MRLLPILLLIALSGCATPSAVDDLAEGAITDLVALDCSGKSGIAVMEFAALGSCWGHIGHHTYFLGGVRTVTAWNASIFAVEIEYTESAQGPTVFMTASADGHNWTTLAEMAYPLGDGEGRHRMYHNWTGDAEAAFLRIHMPQSIHDGLAGYLDHSNGTVEASAIHRALAPPPAGATCEEGLLDSFFAEHPCWFGGRDGINGEQPGPQIAAAETHESWFDSPSFLHTYRAAAGAVVIEAKAELWRLGHVARCTGTDFGALPSDDLVALASTDGANWTEVARVDAMWGEVGRMEATLPDGTQFLQLHAGRGAGYEQGGCHHPIGYMVESAWQP